MEFSEEYPSRPPKCRFPKGFYHPNIYPSGTVCLSILNEEEDWRPSISIKQILLGIQELLNTPNTLSPAQRDAYNDITNNRTLYDEKIRQQTIQYAESKFSLNWFLKFKWCFYENERIETKMSISISFTLSPNSNGANHSLTSRNDDLSCLFFDNNIVLV